MKTKLSEKQLKKEEVSDKLYGEIRRGVEAQVGKDRSDDFFYNELAYMTKDKLVYKNWDEVKIQSQVDAVKAIVDFIVEIGDGLEE
jgi:acyl-CoA-binding protein